MYMHPTVLKLARQALDLSQEELAEVSGVAVRTLRRLEVLDPATTLRTLELVQRALEKRGIIFIGPDQVDGPGFKLPNGHLKGVAENADQLGAEESDQAGAENNE